MNISTWLRDAAAQLRHSDITSARLDAELILSHTLRRSRTYLHAHGDDQLDSRTLDIAGARIQLRIERVPIAYIIGHKEFYGRRFAVNPSVLIPRPESESIIEWLLELTASEISPKRLIDVGTGSGALGITVKLERPHLHVTLSDVDRKALAVASKNADNLGADVTCTVDNLLDHQGYAVDYILANLPYVSREWSDTSPELKHEPSLALYADEKGLRLIYRLLPQIARWLTPDGTALLEADPTQHAAITAAAEQHGLVSIGSRDYCLGLQHA